MKKAITMLLALALLLGLAACGGKQSGDGQPVETPAPNSGAPVSSKAPTEPTGPNYEDMGTVLWLTDLTEGIRYEAAYAYMTAICGELGYELTVVCGDAMNDAAGNLLAVQNSMTDDVVALIAGQDGGLTAIMENYPDLWVCGYNTDLRSVYEEDGENSACLENPRFLGTVCNGYYSGTQLGADLAAEVIAKGYKSVAVVNVPFFAYPDLGEATTAFYAAIEAYNKDAAEPISVDAKATTLMFDPLSEQWFGEGTHGELDAVVALCDGIQLVYPAMKSAMANGICPPETVLLTVDFDNRADVAADVGEGHTIRWIRMTPAENAAYPLVLIDNALTGKLPADFTACYVEGVPYTIDSAEDMENVLTKSMTGTADVSLAQLSVAEVVALCGRNRSDVTHADLILALHADTLSVDALKDR